MSVTVLIKDPQDCSGADIDLFENLVLEGGEVTAIGLRERIRQAKRLVFLNDGCECEAIGAIKNPNVGYKDRVFEKACAGNADSYQLEVGWLYVLPISRGKGYGRLLMETITTEIAGSPCFATTRENKHSMHHLFDQYGFKKLGCPYKSDGEDYALILYARG